MGQEKAQLIYREDTPEFTRLYQLLEQYCTKVTLCHRGDQDYGLPKVIDPGNGPLSAIHALQQAYPDQAILIIACDLPLLEGDDIAHLIDQQEDSKPVTSYISRHDGLPEPLCAIYRPSSASAIQAAVEHQTYCPRSVLASLDIQLIETLTPISLMNANTPADRLEVISHLEGTRTSKHIQLRYFAQLQEQAGISAEEMTTTATTPAGLYEEVKTKHQFQFKQHKLMVAVNDNFSSWEHPLADGDEVVFIPPVAGG